MKYFTLAIHYPKENHIKDILNAMNTLAKQAQNMPGYIEMSAWVDEKSNRIFAMSLWQSKEDGMMCWQKLGPVISQFPLSDWERQQREVFINLTQGSE